jgi:CubicO group peptidase (beta-lactamase class C family)
LIPRPGGVLIVWLAALGASGTGAAAASEPDPARIEALVAELDELRHEHGVAAVALTLVSRDRILWSGARGLADRATHRPASAGTVFRVGSITKAFTGLALLIAERDGRLRLDEPLRAYAPDAALDNPWAETRPVRLDQLLEHTAGLLDLSQQEWDHSDPAPIDLAAGLAVAPEARRVLWAPGMHSSYSNAGAGLAGYALERATGQGYEDFVVRRILRPIGMERAGFFLDDWTRDRLATGYDSDGVTVIPYWHMIFRPFGGLNASPREMGAFVRMLLNRGRVGDRQLIDETSIDRLESPRTSLAARDGLSYGYGLGVYQHSHRGFVFHGHGGDADGYLSHFAYSPALGLGYYLVINAFKGDVLAEMRQRVEDLLVQGHRRPSPPPRHRLSPEAMRALAGHYEAVTYRFAWEAEARGQRDRLCVAVDGERLLTRRSRSAGRELIPVADRHFRRRGEPLATIAFVESDGELYLQGDLGTYRRIARGCEG